MNTAGSGFSRFDLEAKKSSLAASARPPTRADARSASDVKVGLLSTMLSHTAYGKSRIRLVQVRRHHDRHDVRDLTVAIRFEGEYDASYTDGDNSRRLSHRHDEEHGLCAGRARTRRRPEAFGLRLADALPRQKSQLLKRVRIDLTDNPWKHLTVGGREHGESFLRRGPDTRTATVQRERGGTTRLAPASATCHSEDRTLGVCRIPRDEYTTLAESTDRLLATALTATWHYGAARHRFRCELAGRAPDAARDLRRT